jgi:serine/threonine protein kinase
MVGGGAIAVARPVAAVSKRPTVVETSGGSERDLARPGGDLPRVFGPFLFFDHIGRGGMADIYLAMYRGAIAERRVVVKQILPELSSDAGFEAMLRAEAKLAAQLNHANVVQTIELGREADRLYIVMEYIEGFDLQKLLVRLSKARIPLPAEFAIFIVRETLRALDYAHRAKDAERKPLALVHRDVSPSNVLISFEGEVKLCDFGIARAFGSGESDDVGRIAKTRVVGKSAYMAPEHARGETIDQRADLFAAGILLWELCSGRRMYRGSEEDMLAQARAGIAPALPDRGLPNGELLRSVVDKALSESRDDRYQTAAEFLDALEEYSLGARLMASQLRFGSFLSDHFADEIVHTRRARERAAKAELSPVAQESVVRTRDRSDGEPIDPVPAPTAPIAAAPERAPARRSSRPPVPRAASEAVLLSASDLRGDRRSSRPPAPLGAPPIAPHPSAAPPPAEPSSKIWIWFTLGLLVIGVLAFALTAVLVR